MGVETAGTFKATLQRVVTTDDGRVVGLIATPRRGTASSWMSLLLVLELKDGRVTDGREHFYDLYAWEEFWS